MSRRSFGSVMRAIAREAAHAERTRQQAVARQQAAHRRALQDTERQAKADGKEAARLHLAAQMEEADALTREVEDCETAIETLLARALARNPAVNLDGLLKIFEPGCFDERPWVSSAPSEASFMPEFPGFFARLMPGASGRLERKVEDARNQFRVAEAEYQKNCRARAAALEAFEKAEGARKTEIERENDAVRELQRGLDAGAYAAVVAYFKLVLDRSLEGEPDAVSAEIGYSPDSRHLVVDLDLPELSAVPEQVRFKYVKSADRIDPVPRPASKRKALYAHLISQIALKCVDAVFRGSPAGLIDCLTLKRHAGHHRSGDRPAGPRVPTVGPNNRRHHPQPQPGAGSTGAMPASAESLGVPCARRIATG